MDHFEIGSSLKLDPEQKDLLPSDCEGFENLFFLPHFSAIMNAGRKLPQDQGYNGWTGIFSIKND